MDVLPIFKALSDEKRLKIVQLLSRNKYCVRALSRHLKISESAVSQHIKVLKNAGVLVVGDKNGYNTHYAVNKDLLTAFSLEMSEMANSIVLERECGGNCKENKK